MRPSLLPLLLGVLWLLPACAPSGTATVATGIDTTGDLIEYLGARGYVLRPAGTTLPHVLDVAGQVYEVQNAEARIAIYEFDSAQAAEQGADAFQLETLGGDRAALYQRGRLVVASSGGDASLELTLTQALGPATY